MQILIILFLIVCLLAMWFWVYSLLQRNRKLSDNLFFAADANVKLNNEFMMVREELDEAESERRRFTKANFHLHRELDSTHRMIAMTLGRNLENNITYDNIAVEIGRNGVHYKFSNKEDADEGDRRPDEESTVASRHSSEQAPEEREDVSLG